MSEYKTRAEELWKVCFRCAHASSHTTTELSPYFCMAFHKYVSPINFCVWFVPKEGYER